MRSTVMLSCEERVNLPRSIWRLKAGDVDQYCAKEDAMRWEIFGGICVAGRMPEVSKCRLDAGRVSPREEEMCDPVEVGISLEEVR